MLNPVVRKVTARLLKVNASGRTVDLGSTLPLIEMGSVVIFREGRWTCVCKGGALRMVDNHAACMY